MLMPLMLLVTALSISEPEGSESTVS